MKNRCTFNKRLIIRPGQIEGIEDHPAWCKHEVDLVHRVGIDGEGIVLCAHTHPADEIACEDNRYMRQIMVPHTKTAVKVLEEMMTEDDHPADFLIPHIQRILNAKFN